MAIIDAEDPRRAKRMGVTVAICTYRRASIIKAVESVARQRLPPNIAMRILVIDNDATPTAKDMIEDLRDKLWWRSSTGTFPARTYRLRAMPLSMRPRRRFSPSWMMMNMRRPIGSPISSRFGQGAEVVFGPCEAIYPNDAPYWLKAGDYHSNRIPRHHRTIDTGYTSNVLVDMEFVRLNGLKFDPALGETGGEDTMFFHALHKRGGTLRYAPKAVVHENVVASRLNLTWVRLRRYRAGQVYAMMLYRFSHRAYRRAIWTAPVKILACLFMSCLLIFRPAGALWWLMRGAFHVGVLSFGLGAKVHREYRRS